MAEAPKSSSTEIFFQGFLAGAIVARLNKNLLLGALCGLAAGAFYQQQVWTMIIVSTFVIMMMVFYCCNNNNKKNVAAIIHYYYLID